MDRCLNLLDNPEVFLLVATLIVLVLLVWAQLSKPRESKDLDRDFNLVCGFVWTYLAIFFALVAVAFFIIGELNAYANGFLILSFFMTIVNILIAVFTIPIKIVLDITLHRPASGSLTNVKSGLAKVGWFFIFWKFLLVGLGFISFALVNKLGGLFSPVFWVGKALVAAAVVYAVVYICCCFSWRRLCGGLRWELWKLCRCCIKCRGDFLKSRFCVWIRNHWCKKENNSPPNRGLQP